MTLSARASTEHRSLAVSVLLLGFILTVMAGLLAAGANDALLAAAMTTVEIALALVLALVLPDEAGIKWASLATPLLVFGLALACAAAPLAGPAQVQAGRLATPEDVKLELLKLVGCAAAILAGYATGVEPRRSSMFGVWLTALGGAYALLSLALWRLDPFTVGGLAKEAHRWRFTGTLFDANVAGCVFGMFALIALGLLRRALDRTEDILSRPGDLLIAGIALLSFVLGTAACALTGSRTSLAGLVLLSLFVSLWRGRRTRSMLIPPAAALVGAALGGMTTLARYQTLARDLPSREAIWRLTLRTIRVHPAFGVGLGGFERLKDAGLTPRNAADLWSLGAAHQSLLQAAAEGGAPFAALIVAALILVGAPTAQVLFGRGPVRGLALGAVAAVALAAGCSMFGIELNVPAVAALSLFLLGVVAGQGRARRSSTLTPTRSAREGADEVASSTQLEA